MNNNTVKIGLVTFVAKNVTELKQLLERKLRTQQCEDDFSEYMETVNRLAELD